MLDLHSAGPGVRHAAPTSTAPPRPAHSTNTAFWGRRPDIPPLSLELQRRFMCITEEAKLLSEMCTTKAGEFTVELCQEKLEICNEVQQVALKILTTYRGP
jgi:hypothetical protein